jgi:hypothetical protein
MKKYSSPVIITIAVAVLFGVTLSALFIRGPSKKTEVVNVTAIPLSFPDVKNDPVYKAFLNSNAFDPTQSVRVGGSQNSTPFNGAQ